ncbi:MAG TPA: hypothetical protein VMS65_03585 [Polyangiaceae bacterium]|nr:hypothetical protein [Polyangiaceae bacterium]
MRTLKSWSILAVGFLAAACGAASKPEARTGGDPEPSTPAPVEPSAFPADGETAASARDEGSADLSSAEAAPKPAAPPPAKKSASAAESRSSAGSAAPQAREESQRRAIEKDDERPGLGTQWGETRSSHVSNAPFERASSNPFSLTTVRYNDHDGIAAMLRGGSFVNVSAESAPAAAGLISVRLLDENGVPLPTFMDGGRTLVQGEHGRRYVIEVANRSSSRFEAVVSVDGLDVVDGQPGSFSKRGYLIQPFATVEIDGFRQNMDAVAAFRFGSVRGSYASRKGSDRNVGVIGVAFFAERGVQVWTERELGRREGADPFPGRFASPPIAR